MTKTITTYLLQLAALSCVIAIALGINYLSAATLWKGPTALPPGSNADAPLNVGTTNQVKDANLSVGHSTNIATDYGLVSYGRVRSTIGGFEFPDGSLQTSAAVAGGGKLTAIRQYTTSATWTKPAGLSYVVVEVWGGGGGGSGGSGQNGILGGTGGTSSFGSYVSATGGINSTSPGSGVGGDVNLVGGDGGTSPVGGSSGSLFGGGGMSGGIGGSAPRGGATSKAAGKVPGGGGAGASWSNAGGVPFYSGSGGEAGGYSMKLIDKNTLLASESVVVGIGGSAPYAFAGAAGMVVVYEYQ